MRYQCNCSKETNSNINNTHTHSSNWQAEIDFQRLNALKSKQTSKSKSKSFSILLSNSRIVLHSDYISLSEFDEWLQRLHVLHTLAYTNDYAIDLSNRAT